MCASTDRCSKRRRVRTFFRRHFGFFPSQNHIAVLLARAETSTYVPSSEEIRILDRQGRVERVRDGWLIMHGAIERDVKVVFHPV